MRGIFSNVRRDSRLAAVHRPAVVSAPVQFLQRVRFLVSIMWTCGIFSALLVLPSFIAPNARAFLPHPLHVAPGSTRSGGRSSAVCMTASGVTKPRSAADKLRDILSGPDIAVMPCCYDG